MKGITELTQNNENGKFKHLMIDLETIGTQSDSVVLSIGVVCFNINNGSLGPEKEWFPIVETQSERKMEWGSIKFWLDQPDNVRKQQKDAVRIHNLKECLSYLKIFCEENLTTNFKVWGNGFDIPLLNHAYSQINMQTPWSYKCIFDVRTIAWLSKISTNKYTDENDQKHNAISDCKYQIRFITDAFKILKDY